MVAEERDVRHARALTKATSALEGAALRLRRVIMRLRIACGTTYDHGAGDACAWAFASDQLLGARCSNIVR